MGDHGHGGGGCCGGGGGGHMAMPARQPETLTQTQVSLTITPTAASKLKDLMVKESKDPATHGLRLGVQGGGCSGLSYFMDFDTKQAADSVFEQDGVKVYVDPRSIMHLSGAVLDYTEGLMGAGFAIKNPNVKSSCGCGHSFST